MDRFNIPVPPDEDFPEVVVAQRMGEGFEREYVEYEPRWRFDRRRRAVVADEKFFYAMADTAERLKAENAKLREELDAAKHDLSVFSGEIVASKAENTKLRELVRDMWFWGYEGHMDSKSQEWQMKHIDGVLDRMRELGVEVDE